MLQMWEEEDEQPSLSPNGTASPKGERGEVVDRPSHRRPCTPLYTGGGGYKGHFRYSGVTLVKRGGKAESVGSVLPPESHAAPSASGVVTMALPADTGRNEMRRPAGSVRWLGAVPDVTPVSGGRRGTVQYVAHVCTWISPGILARTRSLT